MPLDVLGPFDVVDRTVWLNEVLTDSLDVVNHDQLDLIIFHSGGQVDEDLAVLINVVHVRHLDTFIHHGISDWRTLLVLSNPCVLSHEVVCACSKQLSACV